MRPLIGWIAALLLAGTLAYLGYRSSREVRAADVYRFDPARVAPIQEAPPWMSQPLAFAFTLRYAELAGPPFSLLDDEALDSWRQRMLTLAWVRGLRLERSLPNGLQLDFDLRRPELVACALRKGRLVPMLLAEDGYWLSLDPRVRSLLPSLKRLEDPKEGFLLPPLGAELEDRAPILGLPLLLGLSDEQRRGGRRSRHELAELAALAGELRTEFLPELEKQGLLAAAGGKGPRFLAIDASNQGLRLARHKAEFRLLFRSSEGRAVYLAFGHSPKTELARIPIGVKRELFGRLSKAHPGLNGIVQADLRFPRRWRDRVELR